MAIHPADDGSPNVITYLFTDLQGNPIAELPCTGVTWSQVLNGAGSWQGTLAVEDPKVAELDWIAATDPNLSMVWVDINGTLVWGGIVDDQVYDHHPGQPAQVRIHATDLVGFLSRRLQAKDYSVLFSTRAYSAMSIADRVLTDMLAAGSLPVGVATSGSTPAAFFIPFAAPISQQQGVGSLLGQLQSLGYQVGFDYSCDYAYVAGIPTCTINLSYPRRGRVAGTTGLEIDLGSALGVSWPKDGTAQANRVLEMAAASGGVAVSGTWAPALAVDGYPLLERTVSRVQYGGVQPTVNTNPHGQPRPVPNGTLVMQAYAADDLAIYAYPTITPQVTLSMFDDPVIGSYIVGDDTAVLSAPQSGDLPATCPRFPNGLDIYLRIIQAAHTVNEQGVCTTVFTLAVPPSSTPQRPPT